MLKINILYIYYEISLPFISAINYSIASKKILYLHKCGILAYKETMFSQLIKLIPHDIMHFGVHMPVAYNVPYTIMVIIFPAPLGNKQHYNWRICPTDLIACEQIKFGIVIDK